MTPNTTTVRVRGKALWVGGNMYPLQHIVHTQQTTWPAPRRSRTISRFIYQMLILLFSAMLALASHAPTIATASLVVVGSASLWQLISRLSRKTLYELAIEMSTSKITVLTSHDRQTIEHLAHGIAAGINNPQAEFSFQAHNLHVGDKITQYGDHNTGKRVGL
ncbi:DUF6232 family protein [Kitasatospora sp. NPDC089509]|uniref:DUF6232 family protein n=1 Tax=Kitasatospora sp. NPDC089509 TaxID=3364079 RepID=UPI003808051C